MKSASLPPIRVEPALRRAAEAVLHEGESLSGFMEQSLKDEVARRQQQDAFIARGLSARDDAKRTNEYFGSEVVHAELHALLAKANKKGKG